MAISVTHTTQATGTDAGNGDIRKAQWNEAHTVEGAVEILAQSWNAQTVGAVTTETTLATVTVPAGAMGANGTISILSVWSNNNSAGFKTMNIRFGGASGTLFQNITNSTNIGLARMTILFNTNSASAQKSYSPPGNSGGWGALGSSFATSTVDTTSAVDIVFTGTKSSAGDTLTLEGYQVLLSYKA